MDRIWILFWTNQFWGTAGLIWFGNLTWRKYLLCSVCSWCCVSVRKHPYFSKITEVLEGWNMSVNYFKIFNQKHIRSIYGKCSLYFAESLKSFLIPIWKAPFIIFHDHPSQLLHATTSFSPWHWPRLYSILFSEDSDFLPPECWFDQGWELF